MKARSIVGVPIKTDGSTFAIVLTDDQGSDVTIEFPGAELHGLARLLQAAAQHVPADSRPATGTAKSFPLTRHEVVPAFPAGLSLSLYTQAFGRMGFAMTPDTALQIAQALRLCAESIQSGQSTPSH